MREESIQRIRALVRDVPDFPKPGIVFKDLSPLLADPEGLSLCTSLWQQSFASLELEGIVGIEARGFIFGAALAARCALPFYPVRKAGKLPGPTQQIRYALEYGEDTLEMRAGVLRPKQRLLIVDDVLATGGTCQATADLLRLQGAEPLAAAFVLELGFLEGAQRLGSLQIESLLRL